MDVLAPDFLRDQVIESLRKATENILSKLVLIYWLSVTVL